MLRRTLITALWLLALTAASILLSIPHTLTLWQAYIILCPFALLFIALTWTSPHPEFNTPPQGTSDPIEDIPSSQYRQNLWLSGPWEFRLERETRWRRIDVPRPWNTIPGLEHYNGRAYYRRIFTLPPEWTTGRTILHFRAVNYKTIIFIDGKQATSHEGGFTPFSIDITDKTTPGGTHEISLSVDNTITQSALPNVIGWSNDGGIFRETYIQHTPEIYIEDTYILSTTDLHGRADIAMMLRIHNPTLTPIDCLIEIHSPQGALIHQHTIEGWSMQTLQHRLTINFVSLWSPDSPSLYTCTTTLTTPTPDQHTTTFGIREFETTPQGFTLNGKPFRFRCISRNEEDPQMGRTQSLKLIKSDLEKIKNAGFNSIRLGPFPPHPATIQLCDQIGLLALEELPIWNTLAIDLTSPELMQAAEVQLREMITRDRNHPSIALWGIAHAIESNTSEARWFIERLATLAHGLDDRPICLATASPHTELCADLVDTIITLHSTDDIDTIEDELSKTPFGPNSLTFHYGISTYKPANTPHAGTHGTEERQAKIYRDFIDKFDNNPATGGWILSSLCNYRDPSNITGSTPFIRSTGILNHQHEPKLAYNIIRQQLTQNQSPPITYTKHSTRTIPPITRILTYLILIIGTLAALTHPTLIAKMAFNPKAFTTALPHTWLIMPLLATYIALCWSTILFRYLHRTPKRLLGTVDISLARIISAIFHSETSLFTFLYFAYLYFWLFASALIALTHPQIPYNQILCLTAATSLPEILFALPAFAKTSLRKTLIIINTWELLLLFVTFGPSAAIIYTIIAPATLLIPPIAIIEYKYHVLRYIRKHITSK